MTAEERRNAGYVTGYNWRHSIEKRPVDIAEIALIAGISAPVMLWQDNDTQAETRTFTLIVPQE